VHNTCAGAIRAPARTTQMNTAAQLAMMRSIKRHGSKRGGKNGAS
jgi:hypothetical protein